MVKEIQYMKMEIAVVWHQKRIFTICTGVFLNLTPAITHDATA
jgi:hypothetical protein